MRRAQLTLRDLFWLMVVVGLGIGWTRERISRDTQRTQHIQELADMYHKLLATSIRLGEAEDLLESEGVVFGDGTTIHTTPERAAVLRKQRTKP